MRAGRLAVGGRLDRYVGGLFLASYATSFLVVVGLVLVLHVASNLDWFEPWESGERTPTATIVRFYLLEIPFLYLQVAPFVTVVAGLFSVTRLVRKRENVAVMAAGVSMHRMLASVFAGGALAAVGMFALREGATAAIGPRRDALFDMIEEQRREPVHEKVWYADERGGLARLGTFRLRPEKPPYWEILDLQVTLERGERVQHLRADRAVWAQTPGGPRWILEGGMLEELGDPPRRRPVSVLDEMRFAPRDVLLAVKGHERPLELSFAQVQELARRDPDNRELQTLMQYHLTFPLANLVLLLVALPFLVGQERGRHLEGLVAGCLLCVFYFAFDFMCRSLGMDGDLSPLMASWLPVLLFGSLGAVLFDSMRT